MKLKLAIILMGVLFISHTAFAGFDELLKDVLVETVGTPAGQTQAIGSGEYVFSPGEAIIQKETFSVIYSGNEVSGADSVLLLTLVENQVPVLLKYTNPQTIRVKGFSLQVISFDNTKIRVKVLSRA